MNVAPTNLTTGSLDAASSAITDSISPGTNTLILITVTSRTNISTNPNEPTVNGCDLNWVPVDSVVWDTGGASRKRSTAFRAMGVPTPGALEIDFGGQSQTDTVWIVDELTGVDPSGTDGSGAVVQCVSGFSNTFTQNFFEITLSAFASAGNATYGVFSEAAFDTVITNGPGFTRVAVVTGQGTQIVMDSQFRPDNDTTVSWTASRDIEGGGFAFEIAAAPPADNVTLDADAGSMTVTGQNAALRVSRKVTAATGSYSITGIQASLKQSRLLRAGSGAVALTGDDAQVKVTRKLTAAVGLLALNGIPAALELSRTLSVSVGAVNVAGLATSLKHNRAVHAQTGLVVVTSGNAQLIRRRGLRALPGDILRVGRSGGESEIGAASTTLKVGPDR